MMITPEAQLLIMIGLVLAVAYLGIFPTLAQKTLNRLMFIDFGMGMVALMIAGIWFWGSGVPFTLLFYETNWIFFTIVSYSLLEIPLFLNFAKKHNIPLDGSDDDGPG